MTVVSRGASEIDPALLYQIEVNSEESEYLYNKLQFDDSAHTPDIDNFLKKPGTQAILSHLQNFVWTNKRLYKSLFTKKDTLQIHEKDVNIGLFYANRTETSIVIDVTASVDAAAFGGIDRVCRQLSSAFGSERNVIFVAIVEGELRKLSNYKISNEVLSLISEDTFLILDAYWSYVEERSAIVKKAREIGAVSVLCLHDAIQFLYPGLVMPSYAQSCAVALCRLLPDIDAISTVSLSSAKQISGALVRLGHSKKPIIWAHLGSAFEPRITTKELKRTFVSIGTIEPKKGYAVTLSAFDQLWKAGVDASFILIGRKGWLCEALVSRILRHPEYGRRLKWMNNASDEEAEMIALRCCGLIQASIVEGFGLPIIEAASIGLPVIASDIPVFREIAGNEICYFPPCDAEALGQRIVDFIETDRQPPTSRATGWSDASAALISAINRLRKKLGLPAHLVGNTPPATPHGMLDG